MTKIPVVEVSPLGTHTDVVFIPVEDIDDFLGELSCDYDLGLGELSAELGAVKVKAKASLNVKAKAPSKPKPKPAAKKSAPKPKPAPKPMAKKPTPKPVAKPAAKKSKPTKTVGKVAANLALFTGKAPTKAKPAPKPKTKPATKVAAKVTVKASTSKKPVAKSGLNLLSLAKKATVVLGKAKTKATIKPVAIKTTIKAGPVLKLRPSISFKTGSAAKTLPKMVVAPTMAAMAALVMKPKKFVGPTSTAKKLEVVNKVASLATSIKTLPAAAQKTLTSAVSKPAEPIKVAAKIERLNEIQKPGCTTCVIASKKPEKAALNDRPEVANKFVAKIMDAANLSPDQFQSEVIGYLKQIEGNCSSQELKAKLQKLARASGVMNALS